MKKITQLLMFIVCLITLISCSDDNIDLTENLLVQSSEKIDISELNLTENNEYQEFIRKLQIFSAKLSVAIYQRSDKSANLCISPVSVYMALAMTITNSTGQAKEELLNAVGVTENEVNSFTKYLYSCLKQEKYTYDDELKEKKLTSILDLNNSIWIDKNIELKQEGLNNLADNFMTDSYYAPFKDENKKANALLSEYIEEKTRGLIKPQLELPVDTLFALVNTLYLKDFWYGKDDVLNYSKDEYEFTSANGKIIKKSFLESNYHYGKVYETETYSNFYVSTDNGYKLKLFIPKDGYNLDDVFTVDNLIEINQIKKYDAYETTDITHYTRTIFPAFEADYDDNLVNLFKEDFNVKAIFQQGNHMTGLTDEELFISGIIHQTKLKVDEKGIEGAAVTIMAEVGTADPDTLEFHNFIINKAFGYLLTDNYGNVLFSGVVNTI